MVTPRVRQWMPRDEAITWCFLTEEGIEMKHLLFVSALAFSGSVLAACPDHTERPMAAAPVVPDGATATDIQMHEAGVATRDFIAAIENWLACEPPRFSIVHNMMVERAEDAAESYNAELKEFRGRESMVASK